MDTIVSQVLAATLAVLATMAANVEDVARDMFVIGEDPGADRDQYIATVRALAAHQGSGNRVVVVFPDTRFGRLFGHMLATAALDAGSARIDLPTTAEVTDHNGSSILAW